MSHHTAPKDQSRLGDLRQCFHALVFGTLVSTLMLGGRWWWVGSLQFTGFFGNILLAWIPLIFSLGILRLARAIHYRWLLRFMIVCWFLFYPNANYIVTDLIHLKKFGSEGSAKWFDMLMTTSFACNGLFIGFVSLYIIQWMVFQRHGEVLARLFVVLMLGMSAFGIYLGRFLRLNSWDVLVGPFKIADRISRLWNDDLAAGEMAAFSTALFFFMLSAYWFFASMMHLRAAVNSPALER